MQYAINCFALLLLNFLCLTGLAQDKQTTIPIYRQVFHDRVDKQQVLVDKLDGKADQFVALTGNKTKDEAITKSFLSSIDELQTAIENDSRIANDQDKKKALVAVESFLANYISQYRRQKMIVNNAAGMTSYFKQSLGLTINNKPIDSLVVIMPYETATIVYQALKPYTASVKNVNNLLVLKYCSLYPDKTFTALAANPNVPFADSLIRIAARKYPDQLYNYAQANITLGYKIRNMVSDDFIRPVVRMAQSKNGQQYFPFLDKIVNGQLTIEGIDTIMNDPVRYYRLLVQTRMEFVARAQQKDTALGFRELNLKMEKKAREVFVDEINGLHEQPDAVRFKIIQPLTAEELYYVAVAGDGLIYTSSYTNGVYPLMMKKAGNHGDSLLQRLHLDRYRKFISQAAAYNKLGDFLSTFPEAGAHQLMSDFVNELEKSDGLEDGVDVADSYASIFETLKPMAAEMLQNVQKHYQRNKAAGNQRGIAIYNILQQLFLSADTANTIDLTQKLGIPPVYTIPYTSLTDSSGEVVMQVFFYGDKDGQTDYNIFLSMFKNGDWKTDKSNPQWTVIRSASGKPVTIYANIPFDEQTSGDEKAQQALEEWFDKKGIRPSITINRGHSYHAETTIAYMSSSSRIVFMGSCGGFRLIDAILKKSPDAHIIASKQIGKRDINKPFIQLLSEKLRQGKNIEWIPFWKEFRTRANVEGFEDYIPPYKNLGAIFIKAYKIAMGESSN